MSNTKQAPKVGFVSLGCPKNLVDSERILTQLRTEGYDVVPSYDDAELVVVNTCGFIDSAVQESLEAIGEVLAEAKRLKEAGVKEILVISQDTSAYGVDVKHRTGFYDGMPVKTSMVALCEELAKLDIWVRLHYVYPYPHVDDVIPLMRDGKVLPYLDIPLQHASPRILKLMKRPGTVERTLERIQKWREICPEITLRSTFIVGFPGETEEEFQMLLDFIDKAELDRVGCFKYSPVEGAKANELPDPVPEDVQEARFQRFMELQQQVSVRKLARKVGKEMTVLIDEVDEEGATGRSFADAPEIDGLVYLNGETSLKPGDMVKVRIDEADEYDLWASLVN